MRLSRNGCLLVKSLLNRSLSFGFSQCCRWAKVPSLRLTRYHSRSFPACENSLNLNCEHRLLETRPVFKEELRLLQAFSVNLWTNKPENSEEGKIAEDALNDDPEVRKWLEEIRKDFEKEDERSNNVSKQTVAQMSREGSDGDNLAPSLQKKYKIFRDEESKEILDELEDGNEEVFSLYAGKKNEFAGLNLKRGIEGVFDVEELVEILRKENLQDVCTIRIPAELHYCDYLIITSAISERHVVATSEFIKKLYKKKKSSNDPNCIIEGKQCRNWQALDMGNIVLHIFMPEERSKYDLETLWTVGSEYDDLSRQPMSEILLSLQKHSSLFTLNDMQPLDQKAGVWNKVNKEYLYES